MVCSPTKFYSGDQIKEYEMLGSLARMGENTNAYRVLVGKLQGKRPLGRPRHRWMENITPDPKA
jgi:hypothetical protein